MAFKEFQGLLITRLHSIVYGLWTSVLIIKVYMFLCIDPVHTYTIKYYHVFGV